MTIGRISSIKPVQGFAGNETYRLRTESGETYYWKSGAAEAIGAEVWACARAREAGVLAPIVTASATAPDAYLISREIPGGPSEDEAVLEQAGEQLRRLHAVDPTDHPLLRDGNRYGFLHEGLRDSWAEVLRRPIDEVDALAEHVPSEVARQLRKLDGFEQLEPGAPALLHGDLHPRHIYAEGNQFTGFIDWGDAAFGDPLFDLGRFSRAGVAATDALLRGYGIERTPELDRTFALYRVVWSLMAMHWELAAGGDWFAAHAEAIEADLPLLS
jgi:aminoglycoside phosphotransferase (APT) family kinase protein